VGYLIFGAGAQDFLNFLIKQIFTVSFEEFSISRKLSHYIFQRKFLLSCCDVVGRIDPVFGAMVRKGKTGIALAPRDRATLTFLFLSTHEVLSP